MDGMPSDRKDKDARGLTQERTDPRQKQTEEKVLITPTVTRPSIFTMIESTTHTITPIISSSHLVRATSKMSELSGPNNQRRIFMLSSMVRPTPTTATRTVAITLKGGRDDGIETVRRLLGPTSTATAMTIPNTSISTLRMGLTVNTTTVKYHNRN